jgi:uncharacterized membrane protein YqiK
MLEFFGFTATIILLFLLSGIRYIPSNRIGIVEKRFSSRGSVKNGFIALNGEAGYQPEVLRAGLHYLWPLVYRVQQAPLVTIPQGQIGYLYARDGQALEPDQVLASNATALNAEDVRAFLEQGGQKGPQRMLLREGTFAINLAQFVVITQGETLYLPMSGQEQIQKMAELIAERDGFSPVIIRGVEDQVGIVTVHDGPSLPQGEIIAPTVGDDARNLHSWHNNFQDPEKFLLAGGKRGRQLQVLSDGTWYINRLFATVELIHKTIVEVGTAGVVVSYTGRIGQDVSGEEYRHGELVEAGYRGVWRTPLLPGKYAFNAYAARAIPVPTTNFILKWKKAESGSHRFDENLTEVSLITKDAFEPSLPLSVVVHIDYQKAPLVIQRFGDIKRLVDQTLDPMVAAYFKNTAQTRTLIQLIQDRAQIQKQALLEMKEKFAHYNLELEEVLIGTPASGPGDHRIEEILAQLRARQIAEEQIETYIRQQKAAVQERELREAEARAAQQKMLTESELSIQVQSNQGKAEYQRAMQESSRIRVLAQAHAEETARLGIAKALAITEQVRAYGGPQLQVTREVLERFAEAIEQAKVNVVPSVMVGAGQSNFLESMLTLLLSDKLKGLGAISEESAKVAALKAQLTNLREAENAEGTENTEKGRETEQRG